MKKALLFAMLLLTVGNLAFAQDVQRRSGAAESDREGAPRQGAVLPGRGPVESGGLALPIRPTGAPVWIEAELRLDGEVIMSERRLASPDSRVIHLFAQEARHLRALRGQDARDPGRVQLRILQDGNPVVDSSLTEFDSQYAADRTTFERPARPAKSHHEECVSGCDAQFEQCASGCSVYACIEECQYYRSQCMTSCPNCDAWVEVSRTRIGREWTGSTSYFGLAYCHYKEYYLVEQANVEGCYPNRTVCDYDYDTIFEGFNWGTPGESRCCLNNDPEFFCGGDTTTC